MIEIVSISIILFVVILMSLLMIRYVLTHKRSPLDYSGWIFGIIFADVLLLVLGMAAIFRYMQIV